MEHSGRYPRLFGNYVLLAPLARGGMGEVHLALSGKAELRKFCAIKQILHYLVDRESVRRFLDEAKVMVKLSHGNVVPVFESGEIEGQYYLVMEYIDGKDLRALWKTLDSAGRRCPIEVALHIVKEICRGLDYVHNFGDLGLVHRDISPPNVLLSYSGEVKVADFGLAYSRLKVQKTAPGVLFGKLSYMAPEQAKRESVDARADIFSVGVILWELVTGRRLFPREGMLREQLQRAFKPEFTVPSKVDPTLPADLDLITTRALAQHPDERYPNAEMMRRDIAALQARIDPTTDASALQRLLRDLYAAEIEEEQASRAELLEQLTPTIHQLRQKEEQKRAKAQSGSHASGWPADIEIVSEMALDSEASATCFDVGTILGQRYRVDGVIGEGGMGVVYRATHLGIDKEVAVKILHPIYSWMPEVVSRFQHEAKAASRIGHPNIIEIFDSGTTDDGCLYFAMECLVGEDLADILANEGLLTVQRTVGIGVQICRALHAAHEVGVVHRDLKPENIFLVAKEHRPDFVKVLDFGVAQSMRLATSDGDRLTSPGTAMGTPEYMAPEQAAGYECDHRADIYAVGSMLYEMLTGQAPDMGRDTMDVFNRKAAGNHTPIRQKRPDIPEQLARLIHWTIEYLPQNRPQSMGHVAYELTKITEGRPSAVASILGLSGTRLGTGNHPVPPPLPANFDSRSSSDELPALVPHLPAHQFQGIAPVAPSTQVHTAVVPTIARTRRLTLQNVVVGVLLVISGMTIGALTLREAPSQPSPRRPTAAPATTVAPTEDRADRPLSPNRRDSTPASAPSRSPGSDLQPTAPPPASAAHPSSAPTTSDRAQTVSSAPPPTQTTDTDVARGAPHHADSAHLHPRTTAAKTPSTSTLKQAEAFLHAGQFEQAREAFEKARRAPSSRGQSLLGLAHVAFQQGDLPRAEAYAKLAATHGGGKPATLLLGNIAFKRGHYSQAIVFYRDVIRSDPNNAEAKRNLGVATNRLGL